MKILRTASLGSSFTGSYKKECKQCVDNLEKGICFLGMIKQLLGVVMTDIKFIHSNSNKPLPGIICLD